MAGNFDRDFGYLMPFLDKISAAAAGAEPQVRAELATLVAGEKARWQRIQALLQGAPARNADLAPRPTPTSNPVRETVPGTFTVGSLRRS